jgi:hypothetical protein
MPQQVVEYQEDLALHIFDQRFEELYEPFMVERAVNDHSACLALVRHRGNLDSFSRVPPTASVTGVLPLGA